MLGEFLSRPIVGRFALVLAVTGWLEVTVSFWWTIPHEPGIVMMFLGAVLFLAHEVCETMEVDE